MQFMGYRHEVLEQPIINLETKNHAVFLVPIMLNVTKNDNTFVRFPLKQLHAKKDVRKLKLVGVDTEATIYNKFQNHFQDLGRLLCVCPLK